MAGVPHHAAEGYIARPIAKGQVALCEQVGSETINGLMPREVVRLYRRDSHRAGYAGSAPQQLPGRYRRRRQRAGLAYADITTGEFAVTVSSRGGPWRRSWPAWPRRDTAAEGEGDRRHRRHAGCRLPSWRFEEGNARQTLLQHFGVRTLEGFGRGQAAGHPRGRVILYYLQRRSREPSTRSSGSLPTASNGTWRWTPRHGAIWS